MTSLDPLLEAAELRFEPLELMGVKLLIREPSAIESLEYREKRATDHTEAMAFLMSRCVLNAEDGTQRWTLEQARKIAGGREEVWTPIVLKLTGFAKLEKKASPQPSGSTTG